ncbi:MAG: S24 family peptidase [Pseudomonadota bacterium]
MSITQLSANEEHRAAVGTVTGAPWQFHSCFETGAFPNVVLPNTVLAARMSSLGEGLVPHCAASALITVPEDSMSGAGILMGDQVIVDRSQVAQHGQIVVALIDERLLPARLFRFNGKFELRSERAGCEPARLACRAQPFVWGVVVACVRTYAPPLDAATL